MTTSPTTPSKGDELEREVGRFTRYVGVAIKQGDLATTVRAARDAETALADVMQSFIAYIQANYIPRPPAIQLDDRLAYMIDSFAQAIIDLGKEQIKNKKASEPSVDYIQAGLHAELVRKDLEAAIQAQIDEAVLSAEQKENELWTTVLNKFQQSLEQSKPLNTVALTTINQIRKLYRYEREQLTIQSKSKENE